MSFDCVVSIPTMRMRSLPMMNWPLWWCIRCWRQPQRNSGIGPGRTLGARQAHKRKADTNSEECRNKSLMHGMNSPTPTARAQCAI